MTQAMGAYALGTEPLAGDPHHDPPTVVVSTIGTITTGGPNITVSWTFDQIQGDTQQRYKVEILDDALAVLLYDSGWLSGAVLSHVIDVDKENLPADSTDVTARVSVEAPGAVMVAHRGSDVDAYQIEWGVPHATIDAPTPLEIWSDLTGVDVAWTFTDDRGGKTQSQYRVRLILTGFGLELFDTGWTISTATAFTIPVIVNPGSKYTVEVQLRNDHGIRSD